MQNDFPLPPMVLAATASSFSNVPILTDIEQWLQRPVPASAVSSITFRNFHPASRPPHEREDACRRGGALLRHTSLCPAQEFAYRLSERLKPIIRRAFGYLLAIAIRFIPKQPGSGQCPPPNEKRAETAVEDRLAERFSCGRRETN
jgi:hypothetical protein